MTGWSDPVRRAFASVGVPIELREEYPWYGQIRARASRGGIKVRTDAGSYWLRRAQVGRLQLDAAFRCTEALSGAGWRPLPRFVRTIYGDPYVVDGTGLYYVTAWISGSACRFKDPGQMEEAVTVLAAWHKSAHGCLGPSSSPDVPQGSGWLERLQEGMDEVGRLSSAFSVPADSSPFQRLFLCAADELWRRIEYATAELQAVDFIDREQTAGAEGNVCHGRFHGDALLQNGEGVVITDYERVHPGLPLTDLASWMQRYLPQHAWDVNLTTELFHQYLTASGTANEAQPDEARLMAALLAIPMQSLQIIRWYARRALNWEEEDYVDALEASLEQEEARMRATQALLARYALRPTAPATLAGGPVDTVATDLAVDASVETPTVDKAVDPTYAVATLGKNQGREEEVQAVDATTSTSAEPQSESDVDVVVADSAPEASLESPLPIRLTPAQRERLQQLQEEKRRMRERQGQDRGIKLWGDARSTENPQQNPHS
ncbi:MAG: hypothetical protein K6T63_03145 [Alicyclobacillus herbarius]|uniref:hypothetical protein n=1 Tax=Alicyclobacillus herbarius TaxID=122960 RepID=UPI0023574427|nr:hypothetical protein [Alicyclobacillus herbarius]MCL6631603.1 hypothetical protein [Alicyclobacillus herbarius]